MPWLHGPLKAGTRRRLAAGSRVEAVGVTGPATTPGVAGGVSQLAALILAIFGLSVVGFSKLAEDVSTEDPIVSFDSSVAIWFHEHAIRVATGLMGAITELGGTRVLTLVTFVATALLMRARRFSHAALMVAALVGGQALNWLLKTLFERPRPSFGDPITTAAGFSFPSGHAMVSLTVYGALAFVIAARVRSPRLRAGVAGLALGLVLSIGLSRVYLGVHYVSDVLAAYTAGMAWLMLCALALLAASRRRAGRWPSHSGLPAASA